MRVRATGAEGLSYMARKARGGECVSERRETSLDSSSSLCSILLPCTWQSKLALGVVERASESVALVSLVKVVVKW